MHHPRDIAPPPKYAPYTDTLGKSEFEWIAAYLIFASQQAGKWVALQQFPKKHVDEQDLQEMITCGRLIKTDQGYQLTRDTIDDLAKAYPTREVRNKPWYEPMQEKVLEGVF